MGPLHGLSQELSVAHSLVKESTALGAVQNHTNEQISFFPIDSYAKLTVVILKVCWIIEHLLRISFERVLLDHATKYKQLTWKCEFLKCN
jgi:hypothetical protein